MRKTKITCNVRKSKILRPFRRNPKNLNFKQILNVLKTNPNINNFEYIKSGSEGTVYYFNLTKNTFIFDKLFKPGEYAIKIYLDPDPDSIYNYPFHLNESEQKYLILLSKYGLIPKIYYIDSNVMIMKFIHGDPIRSFVYNHDGYTIVLNELKEKFQKLINVWKKLNMSHGDIRQYYFETKDFEGWIKTPNILVAGDPGNLKLYIIDPDTRHLKDNI